MRGRARLVVLGAAAPVVLRAAVAAAFVTAVGLGSGPAAVDDLGAPASVTSTARTGLVVRVAWDAVVAPDGSGAGYHVQRYSSTGTLDGSACGTTASAPTTATTCDDTGLTAGTYTYRVTSIFRSWSAQSGASDPVTAASDVTAPTVVSIVRAGATPSNAASVAWTVTFSEAVSGVGASDFALQVATLGGTPAVTTVTGGATAYTVTASTGSGSGTIGLNLIDDDTIEDSAGNKLGGAGTGNGNATGQVYVIDRGAPAAYAISADRSGGTTAGRTDPGDKVVYTFTEVVTAASIKTGWDGAATAVVADIDGGSGCTPTTTSCLRITSVNLGVVDLGSGTYAPNHGARYTLPATMTLATIDGRTVVTITLGGTAAAGGTVTGTTILRWTPSTSVRDLAGNAATTTPVSQAAAANNF